MVRVVKIVGQGMTGTTITRGKQIGPPSGSRALPLVSVIIPAYDAAPTIARAISSALAQTYRPLEIIVVDDCSADTTGAIAESFGNPDVRLVRLQERQGASGARNAGISAARGELVAFLDADDEWRPQKLESQVALIQSDGEFIFVTCRCDLVSPRGINLGDLYHGRRLPGTRDVWKTLVASNCIATPSVLVWRRHIDELGGFDCSLKVGEDQDMWIRLALVGKVGQDDASYVLVHARANSLSSSGYKDQLRYTLPMIQRHIEAMSDQLTRAEIRAIMAERLERIGRNACNENYVEGVRVILRAIYYGSPLLRCLFLLANTLPLTRWIKKHLWSDRAPLTGADGPEPTRPLETHHARRAFPRPAVRSAQHVMLPADNRALVQFPASEPARLVVIVDTEEEFNWHQPFSRDNVSTRSIGAQARAQAIYRRHGVVPTYAIDYPIAMQEQSRRIILNILDAGECEIGAQLHAWVTPPHEEVVCEYNSYAGNLPGDLERRKLEVLTETIVRHIGVRPLLYRAGRYGAGVNTPSILDALRYEIDCSVLPGARHDAPGAPDYSRATVAPYWLPPYQRVLEIPVTVATVGIVQSLGDALYGKMTSNLGMRLRLPGLMARTGLLNRIRVSPEGNSLGEAKRLTRTLIERGHRVIALSYHSPSLEPGNTPYVRDTLELEGFLAWISEYLEFFFGELGGVPATPSGVRTWALTLAPPAQDLMPAESGHLSAAS